MKKFLVFIFCLLLISVLPLLWNQFSFNEVGFPFLYLQRTNFESGNGVGTKFSFLFVNLFLDLIITFILYWLLIYIRKYFKERQHL